MKVRLSRESGHSILHGYEKDHQKFLAGKLKKGMIVCDIGAHVGEYALFFSKLVGMNGKVLSFEPYPDNFKNLQANVNLNHLNNVSYFFCALGDEDRQVGFSFADGMSSMGKVSHVEASYENMSSKKMMVPMKRLDDLIKEIRLKPDLLKIDVEGSAAIVIRGGLETIRECHPYLYVELHGPDEREAIQSLKNYGYKIFDLYGREIRDLTKEWHSPVWCAYS